MSAYDDSIMDLVRACAPERHDLVALIHAYFDESDEAGYFVVGGFIFKKSKVAPFERKWRHLLNEYNLPYFHMTECNSNTGVYSHLSKDECDKAARRAINIICEFAHQGHYTALKKADFRNVFGADGAFKDHYTMCLYWNMIGLGIWASKQSPAGMLSYFFEAGYESQKYANRAITALSGAPNGECLLRYRSHTFVKKEASYPAQAADIMAGHSRKHLVRCDQGKTKPRPDYAAILQSVGHTFYHLTEDRLKRAYNAINETAGGVGGNRLLSALIDGDPKRIFSDPGRVAAILQGDK